MSADTDSVSIVIPMRNAASTIGAQLESLASGNRCPPEVIVVDNGSDDDSAVIAASYSDRFASFRLVSCQKPGANVARNAGVAECSGRHVMFLDADDRVTPEWFDRATGALPWDAFVGGLRDCRVEANGWMAVGTDRSAIFDHGFLPDICTASAGVRVAVWRELGGFDESYSQGGDDTEFFWRVMLEGYEVRSVPEAVVWYRMRSGLRSLWRQRWRHGLADARLYREFHDRGWDVHFRLYQIRNMASGSKSMLTRKIGPREWFARVAVSCGAVYAATFKSYDGTARPPRP